MAEFSNVITAFNVDQASRLTGLSTGQLSAWDKVGFFQPEHAETNRRLPFSRVYSFRDIVGLKTLAILRKEHRIPTAKLKEVASRLEHMTKRPWSELKLSVLKKDVVVLDDDGVGVGASDGQIVLIPLRSIIEDVRRDADALRKRPAGTVGKIEKRKFVLHNAARVAGTRIPVTAVKAYLDAGCSTEDVIAAYPDLSRQDVDAVRDYLLRNAAA